MGKRATRVILLVSACCLLIGLVATYARTAVFDRNAFADRAVATLGQDEVTEEIATRYTDGVLERSPGLVTLRPALQSAAAEVVAGPWFAARFGDSMRELHDDVFSAAAGRPALHIPGMTEQVQGALSRRTPVLAARLPQDADPALLSIGGTMQETALLRTARSGARLTALAPIAVGLGLLGLLAAALGAPDRRRGVWAAALALAAVGGVLTLDWMGARTLTLERFDTGWGDAVVRTIWGAYLGDLRTWALALAGAGIVVAAATRPAPLRLPALSRVPAPVRGAAAVAAGVLLLADRELALDLAAAVAAGVLLYAGACRLLAGPARVPLATGALALLLAVTVLSTGGPAPAKDFAPVAEAVQQDGGSAARATVRGSRTPSRHRPDRICFASMADARLAAEGAAVPRDVAVQRLPDGRVCVRRQ